MEWIGLYTAAWRISYTAKKERYLPVTVGADDGTISRSRCCAARRPVVAPFSSDRSCMYLVDLVNSTDCLQRVYQDQQCVEI